MAQLKSEDPDTQSSFELSDHGAKREEKKQVWQAVVVRLVSGRHRVSTADAQRGDECLICRVPQDEIAKLLYLLNEMRQKRLDSFSFEPAEPFFELSLERSPDHGLKVEAWLDAGNAESGIYTWDAMGVRFHTTEDNLASFIADLEQEFPC
ncbi:MAG: hypothetical protein C5B53_00990 [Candidatus Melainabacteria bacterium]|nr:MAG: hypothetical protein C5B53_00990 [Candidatus Melainabacteria bacterium]